MSAQPIPEFLLMEMSKSLAECVKHPRQTLQYPSLKDGHGTRKPLRSAMNPCLSLEPHHVFI